MKKCFIVFSVVSWLCFFDVNSSVIDKSYLPSFPDLKSIADNNNVQDGVRYICANILSIIKETLQNKNLSGTNEDIKRFKNTIGYLMALQIALEQADTLNKIYMLLSLNKEGKRALEQIQELLQKLRATSNTNDLRNLLAKSWPVSNIEISKSVSPLITSNLLKILDRKEQLYKDWQNTKNLDSILSIYKDNLQITQELLLLKQSNDDLNQFQQIKSFDEFQKSKFVNMELKNYLLKLDESTKSIKNTKKLKDLMQLPIINSNIIKEINEKDLHIEKLIKENENIEKSKKELKQSLEETVDTEKRNHRFSNQLIAVLIRALCGFDYRCKKFDFSKDKATNKSVLISSTKETLSYLGGSSENLYIIANNIQNVLQILFTSIEWETRIDEIEKILLDINDKIKAFNEEANLIKFNIQYALEILYAFKKNATRPPRDNVQNFTQSLLIKN